MNTRTRSIPLLAGLATVMLLGGTAAAAPKAAMITLEKAESIALAKVPGGTVEDIERERKGTRTVYEIEVRAPDNREHDFTIDASDGKIIFHEIERD